LRELGEQVQSEMLAREFALSGTLAALPPVREAIMEFIHPYCADEQQELDIMIALQEALANAVVHGCHGDAGEMVRCTIEISPSAIELIVRDPGQGFDTTNSDDVTEDGTNLTRHGRGIHLMRGLMDEVSYRHQGTELHLKKLRSIPG
jgi:anti-sigma regulatory factor (Ser/Thr protein kinase)